MLTKGNNEMASTSQNQPVYQPTLVWLGVCAWVAYFMLTMLAPVRSNTYHLTALQIGLLQLTIVVPVLIIWVIALRGATRFHHYAAIIRDSPDGKALRLISIGLFFLILNFISQSLIGATRPYFVGTDFIYPSVFLRNQLPVALTLIAFGCILAGSRRLGQTSLHPLTKDRLLSTLLPYVLLSAIFAWWFYSNLQHVTTGGVPNYALPGKAPFYTLAVPYIISWLMGILAIAHIAEYTRHVKGIIYRKALRSLAHGISAVLAFSILLQMLSVATIFILHLSLTNVLILLYVLLFMYALGFVLIDRGARKLIQIENVT
jgi:hypothetical protein